MVSTARRNRPSSKRNADDPTQERIHLLQHRFDRSLVAALDHGKEFLQFRRGHVRCPLFRARTMQRFGGSSPQPMVTPVTRNANERSQAYRGWGNTWPVPRNAGTRASVLGCVSVT